MKKYFLILIFISVLVSCKKPIQFCGSLDEINQFKSESLANEELTRDTLENLRNMETALRGKGEKGISTGLPNIISKIMVSPPNDTGDFFTGAWSENWIVQREGYCVLYNITFIPSEKGGTDISINYPPKYILK
jgi:hypothetical protein